MKLIYVHIPKTGGNTVSALLRNVYGGNHKIFRESHDMHNDHNVMSAVGDKKYPVKHIYRPWKDQRYETSDIIMGHFKKTKYLHTGYPMITWLRDPVERVISNYTQQLTKWPKAKAKAPTYYNLVKDETLMTYAKVWNQVQWWYCDGSIDDFYFVGICERFDESIEKLGKVLGVEFPSDIPRKNPTKKTLKVSKKVKEEISKYQKKDYILYKKAVERLEKC